MVNKVIILGRVANEVELKVTPTQLQVCNFSVATNEKWKDKAGNLNERAEFHRISCFGKTAELCAQYLKKGREVYLEGKINTKSWEDKEGHKKYMTEIIANSVQFLGGKEKSGAETLADATKMVEKEMTTDEVPW